MAKKPRSPQELAKDRVEKRGYSLSLNKTNMNRIIEHANKVGISISEIVDEAIASYLETIKEPSPH